MAFYWRVRQEVDARSRIKLRTAIRDECERRFSGFSRVPLKLRIPYFRELDVTAIKAAVTKLFEEQGWPSFLAKYQAKRLKITTASQPSIEDILSNVRKISDSDGTCACEAVRKEMRKQGYDPSQLPTVKGHIFFTGREYKGPFQRAANVCAKNVPIQTHWDLQRAWANVRRQLPESLCGKHRWAKMLYQCVRQKFEPNQRLCPNTREVYSFRKITHGLKIGPLDRNPGELWFACGCLYKEAFTRTFSEESGYDRVYPCKFKKTKEKRCTIGRKLAEDNHKHEKAKESRR